MEGSWSWAIGRVAYIPQVTYRLNRIIGRLSWDAQRATQVVARHVNLKHPFLGGTAVVETSRGVRFLHARTLTISLGMSSVKIISREQYILRTVMTFSDLH